jgi:hypothetical protein
MILTSSKVPLSLGILQNCVAVLVDIECFIAPVLASTHPMLYLFGIFVNIERMFRNSILVKATNSPMTGARVDALMVARV